MEKGLEAKYRQNKHLLNALLAAKCKTFADASKHPYWSTGLSLYHPQAAEQSRWTGQNHLGRLIKNLQMKLLKEHAGHPSVSTSRIAN